MHILPDWLNNILAPTHTPGTTSSLLVIFLVMALGTMIGKIKINNISLGISGVMFAGLFAGHLGYRLDEHVIEFLRDLGLILFVYAVGMQVGPSFFSSFKKDGIRYNLLAVGTVICGGLMTILLFFATEIGMDNLVGMMSGAVTNTPGLGAAKAALKEVATASGAKAFNDPANAYAISYPFGVIGLILMMVAGKYIFRINIDNEIKAFEEGIRKQHPTPHAVKCRVINPAFFQQTIDEFNKQTDNKIIISRIKHSGSGVVEFPHHDTIIQERDVLMLVGLPEDVEKGVALLGRKSTDKFIESDEFTSSNVFVVTNKLAVHKTIEELDLEDSIGVHATRVFRAGLEMLATPSLVLHYGDKIKAVGDQKSLDKMAKLVGNSAKHLQKPQLLSIFLGVVLGVVLGAIPILLPGLAAPVKLGMAAGPLLVALVISRYGGIRSIHSYLNQSAILFMKDFGICLFFAVVGIHAGESFYETFVAYNGWLWVGYGLTITIIPLTLMMIIARHALKINFIPLLGMMAGTYTDPAALAFGTSYYKSDLPTQAYATVYPMVTIMRILVAQLLVLYFAR
jgi:putative transport protein